VLELPELSYGTLGAFFFSKISFYFLAYSLTFNYFSKAAAFFKSASLTFSSFSFLALMEAFALVLF